MSLGIGSGFSDLLENYENTVQQQEHALKLLIDHVKNPDRPVMEDRLLERITFLVKIALNSYTQLNISMRQKINHLVSFLSDLDNKLATQKVEKTVITLFVEFEGLDQALEGITDFVVKVTVPEPSEDLVTFSSFVCRYLELMHQTRRIQVHQRKILFVEKPPPWIAENESKLAQYSKLQTIFNKIKLESLPPPPPATTTIFLTSVQPQVESPPQPTPAAVQEVGFLNRIWNMFGSRTPEKKDPPSEQVNELKELSQKKQLEEICNIVQAVMEHYFPLLLDGDTDLYPQEKKEEFLTAFKRLFKNVVKDLFLHKGRDITLAEKNLIRQILFEVGRFLKDCQGSIENYEDIAINHKQITQLLGLIISRLLETPKILKEEPSSKHLDDLQCLLIAELIYPKLNKILSPSFLCFIIKRFLDDPFVMPDFGEPKSDGKKEDHSDKFFSSELGKYIKEIGFQLLQMGEPSGIIMSATTLGVQGFMKLKQQEFGKLTEHFLAETLSSECTITPLIVIDHILFRKVDGKRVPALLEAFKMSEEGVVAFQSQLKQDIDVKVFPLLVDKMKQLNAMASLVKYVGPVEGFCKTFMNQLWGISQSKQKLQMLCLYGLKGILRSFTEK